MKNIFLVFFFFISVFAGFSQSPIQTAYVDYSTANFDDLFYLWTFNSNYVSADTAGGGITTPINYAAVAITNPLAGYNNPNNISGSIGEWNYSTSSPLVIDSIFALVTHENNSGQFDKIIMEIVLLDNTDKPTSTVLWSKIDSTNVTLSPGMNWTGNNALFVLRYNPNYTVPSNQKVGLNLRYIGSKLDTFSIIAGSIDNGLGGTNQQSNYKNSWIRIPPFIPNLTKNSNIGYGSPVGSNGWFEAQNWLIWARVKYFPIPTISSFTPSSVCSGSTITITGTNFTGANSVKVGGTPVSSFIVNSSTSITATVGSGTTGVVTVVTPSGTATSPSVLTITPQPSTPTITPTGSVTVCQGQSVTLTSSSASNYIWSNGQQTQSITVSPTQTTSYTVTVGSGNCTATSQAVTVVVNSSIPLPTITPSGNVTICQGQSVTLTSSLASNYNWSNGQQTQSITVAPSQTTSYTVTIGSGNCTATSQAVTVVVSSSVPTPTITPSGSITICQGQSVTLSSSSASNYIWSNGQQTQSITVAPTQTTSYTVTVGSGNCTATSQAVTVVVNSSVPTPTIIPSGSITICQGQSVTLTSSSASNYIWSNGQQTQSITVAPSQTTSYTVTVGSGNCTATSQAITVTVGSAPVITSQPQNQLSSLGQIARFVATTSTPNASYQWQSDVGLGFQNLSNAGQYAGVTNDTLLVSSITPNNNNQIFRCVISSGGCTINSNSAILSVCFLSITSQPQSQTVDLATNATFSVSGSNIQTYQWQSDLGFGFQNLSNAGQYSGVNTNTLTVSNATSANNGQAFRCAVSLDGCSDTTATALLTVNNNVGVIEALIPTFSVYPNPATENITISLTKGANNVVAEVYDIYGKLLMAEVNKSGKQFDLNTSTLAPGAYMVKLIMDNLVSNKAFIKL